MTAAPQSARLDAEIPELERHLDYAAQHFADPAVFPWHWPPQREGGSGPRTREQVAETLAAQAHQAEAVGFCLWWWRERASGELVGMTGLNRDQVEGKPVVEAGWSISPRRQRQGFATEAARASIAWGFEACGLEEIVSFTVPHNRASRAVMESLGMGCVAEIERAGLPHVLYRLGTAEWAPDAPFHSR